MTEPLIVDPERLNNASTILGKAAGDIPVELPKFSVSGTDPLSLAIAAGAVKVEEPMAALPGIKGDAITTAQNIGRAGQMYAGTDQELAAKASRHEFSAHENAPNRSKGDGLRFFGNERTPLSPSPSPSPSPSQPGVTPLTPGELTPFGPEGTVIEKTAKEAAKRGVSPKLPLNEGKVFGKGFGLVGTFGELWKAGVEFKEELPSKGWKNTAIDVLPKTAGSLAGGSLGGTIGAANGAVIGAKTGEKLLGAIPFLPGGGEVGKVLGGVIGAGGGALAGTIQGGEWGESFGKSVSGYLHTVLD